METSAQAAFALLLVTLPLVTLPAVAQGDGGTNAIDDSPHITVVGTARIEVPPDLATITIGVTTERPNATAAAAETAGKAKAVIDAAKAQGVAAPDIATQSVTLTETFDDLHDPRGQYIGRKPRGFVAENVVAIRVRDLAKAGALVQTLIEAGANRFDGISFSVENPEPVLDKLLDAAVRRARVQAEIAAMASGVRLGRVLLIERPSEDRSRPMILAGVARAATTMPIEAGTMAFSREIEVTWAIDAN